MTDELLPILFSRMSDSAILIDTKGDVADLNPAAERFFGARGALVNRPAREALPGLAPLLEEAESGEQEIRKQIAVITGDAVRNFDGISISLSSAICPPFARLLLLRDISDSKKRDDALQESEQRFHELVDLLPEIVFEFDLTGKFTFVNDNALQLFGYTGEDMKKGLNLFNHIIPEDRQRIMQDIGTIASGKKSQGGEYNAVKCDGSRFPFLVYTTPVMRNDRCTGIRGILIDITQRKRIEYAMQQAIKRLSLLNGITRHDLLNKMTALYSYLNTARKGAGDPEVSVKIEHCIDIVSIVNKHVRFMRDYHEIGIQSPAWQDPAVTIRQVTESCDHTGVAIRIPDPGWEVFCDPLFRKVINNLVDNAVRHGRDVKTITFSIGETPAGLLLSCEDDGAGIPEESRSSLFEFSVRENSGQGLFLSREILAITGISIRETGGPGHGARFEILVPAGNYRRIGSSSR
ncbi:MAG: PAS domain-containing sensor histidine kinase [Methanoregula sp.]|nr:PAS domain-containing sensor histidine kinase [Methanoregula sp.]